MCPVFFPLVRTLRSHNPPKGFSGPKLHSNVHWVSDFTVPFGKVTTDQSVIDVDLIIAVSDDDDDVVSALTMDSGR
ncbi:hypothetical protein RRG08_041413 [Elysia crispata]|uniref:Uncharacterized protein n=1 Tax=Elysia crispata TaxID=231223 RepID=A0AAE0XRS3_9GAST|nr:hypothetical protein RRG08_041413 [Elysia crispata]